MSSYLGIDPDDSKVRLLCTSFDTIEELYKKYGRPVETNLDILRGYSIPVRHGVNAVRLPEQMQGEVVRTNQPL